MYEIWTAEIIGDETGPPVFAEDCYSNAEAVLARAEWQNGVTAAWIQDKETGKMIA